MKRNLSLVAAALCLLLLALVPAGAQPAAGFVYVSPAPGATLVRPGTALAFRQGSPLAAQHIKANLFAVSGSKSGVHAGSARLSDDRLTVLYYPATPFAYDETVSVTVGPGLATAAGAPLAGMSYRFTTARRPITAAEAPLVDELAPQPAPADVTPAFTATYRTYPEVSNVMTATVTTPASGTAPGQLFVAGLGSFSSSSPSLLMLDDQGEPIYLKATQPGYVATDFKKQVVNGLPYLTYHQGLSFLGWSFGHYYVMDQSYRVVDTWTMGNGLWADEHDLQLLDNDHALMFAYEPVPFDLSDWGGPADGILVDNVIQELDADRNVVFEWRASQHIPISDSYAPVSQSPLDFMHLNAVAVDLDGNLLISGRHLSEITKIDRQTGAIIWRMGGRQSQFTFTNDEGFSFQHDVRPLADGHITLFDNGNQHEPSYSRAVEYVVDEGARTATRVWQYRETPDRFAAFMGNVQRLANGNSLIGWGGLPYVTEARPDGSKALELALGALSYRAYRFAWSAMPAELPRAVVDFSAGGTTATVYSAWNGATDISSYRIYAGPNIGAMSLITTTTRSGFETVTNLTGLRPTTCVVQVKPVRRQGPALPLSPAVYNMQRANCRSLLRLYFFPFVMR